MADTVYQRVTDQIVSLLERGVVPWRKPWAGEQAWPKNLASGRPYRGINPFLLSVSAFSKGYGSAYWLTYRQAEERGGHVRKGERATTVVFWKDWAKDERDPETGETTTKRIPILRAYSVFNVEQCADVEYPKPAETLSAFDPIAQCETVVGSMPDAPRIEQGADGAWYFPDVDLVRIPRPERFTGAQQYYATLFHELTHSTGAEKRLARPGIVKQPIVFGSAEYAREELIAEMGAAFLCGHCGIEPATIENSASYIDGWLTRLRRDNRLVVQAASSAQKAADWILGKAGDRAESSALVAAAA